MTYGNFTLERVLKSFGLALSQGQLFGLAGRATVGAPVGVPVPPGLRESLDEGLHLALVSEKARSEFIIAPILLASRKQNQDVFAIYSGQRLDVDPEHGLAGECDFILTRTPPYPIVRSPVMTMVEAKKQDIEAGFGQCAAQMVGAHRLNQQEGSDIDTVFGCVTTGEAWHFLKLAQEVLTIDQDRYYIVNVEKILGVFQAIVQHYHYHQSSL
ncbi:MAG: hypothetical protein HC884_12155 [Chloroflexaceae bacterium]|nr:hypothetical protein [Chloroflexaceae bacterium]